MTNCVIAETGLEEPKGDGKLFIFLRTRASVAKVGAEDHE